MSLYLLWKIVCRNEKLFVDGYYLVYYVNITGLKVNLSINTIIVVRGIMLYRFYFPK